MKKFIIATVAALAPFWAMSQILVGQTAGFTGTSASGVQEITQGGRVFCCSGALPRRIGLPRAGQIWSVNGAVTPRERQKLLEQPTRHSSSVQA